MYFKNYKSVFKHKRNIFCFKASKNVFYIYLKQKTTAVKTRTYASMDTQKCNS